MTKRRIVVLTMAALLTVGAAVVLVGASRPVSHLSIRSGFDAMITGPHHATSSTTLGILPQPPTEVNGESVTAAPPQPAARATGVPATAVPATGTPATTAPTLPAAPQHGAPGGAWTSGVLVDGVAQDLPDPYTLRVDDPAQCGGGPAPCYYTFSTESGFLGLINVPVVRSSDLVHWTWAGPPNTSLLGAAAAAPGKDAMPVLAPWAQFAGNWAPSVVARPNNPPASRYVMYYTARSKDDSAWGGKECTGVATSAKVDGPYVDSANAPLICVPAAGGTIDPSPYVAADGSLSLQYADDNGIHAQRLTADGLALAGGEQLLLAADGGYVWEVTRIEGPSMISTPSTGILLFYSVNLFTSPDYAVGVARCDTPLGPCRRLYSTPVLAKRGAMLGPGGQTPVQLPDGSWRLAFHAWDHVVGYDAGGDRTLHFLPLTFPGGNPQVG